MAGNAEMATKQIFLIAFNIISIPSSQKPVHIKQLDTTWICLC